MKKLSQAATVLVANGQRKTQNSARSAEAFYNRSLFLHYFSSNIFLKIGAFFLCDLLPKWVFLIKFERYVPLLVIIINIV